MYNLNHFIRINAGANFTHPFAINDAGEISSIGLIPGCDKDESAAIRLRSPQDQPSGTL